MTILVLVSQHVDTLDLYMEKEVDFLTVKQEGVSLMNISKYAP